MNSEELDLTDTQWAYFAGLFDGEGSVHLRKGKKCGTFSLTVTIVCGTHKESMFTFCNLFGKTAEEINGTGNKRVAWRLRLHALQALSFLKCVSPYVVIKRKQTELGIRFQEGKGKQGGRLEIGRREAEQGMKDELTQLNLRGVRI